MTPGSCLLFVPASVGGDLTILPGLLLKKQCGNDKMRHRTNSSAENSKKEETQ